MSGLLKLFIEKVYEYISSFPDRLNPFSPNFSFFRFETLFIWICIGWASDKINTRNQTSDQNDQDEYNDI